MLPTILLVILVGNLVTEEALPNYSVSLEHIARDPSGTTATPWARWLRGWTAEENRHGDLLNAYLRLTGRVDMLAVERTIHHLIRNGFAPGWDHEYEGLIYASFQERATRITHGNVGKLAAAQGEENLARICRKIAGDETRHETFYTRVVGEAMESRSRGDDVRLPGDAQGQNRHARKTHVRWSRPGLVRPLRDSHPAQWVVHLQRLRRDHHSPERSMGHRASVVSGKAAKAQDYICGQPERFERLASQVADRLAEQPRSRFSWIHGRQV